MATSCWLVGTAACHLVRSATMCSEQCPLFQRQVAVDRRRGELIGGRVDRQHARPMQLLEHGAPFPYQTTRHHLLVELSASGRDHLGALLYDRIAERDRERQVMPSQKGEIACNGASDV